MIQRYYVQEAADLSPNEPKKFSSGPWFTVDIIPWESNDYISLLKRYYFRSHNGNIRRVTTDKDKD